MGADGRRPGARQQRAMSAELRKLLKDPGCVIAPGCHDALSARLVEAAGFPATYLQMYCVNACLFGQPNVGYATLSEVADYARNIAAAISIPLIVDAAVGFGDAISVRRTVRELERAGAAGMHLEDQVRPWSPTTGIRCPLISIDEACTKYHAASEARTDPDFLIIAWSFATFDSLDEALRRCKAYADAGADMVMPIISPFMKYSGTAATHKLLESVLGRIVGEMPVPVATHTPFGRELTFDDATSLGIKLYLLTLPTLGPSAAAIASALRALRAGKIDDEYEARPPFTIDDFNRVLGTAEYDKLAFELGFAKRSLD
jgi:2-methylisocitrate lyase-like PEP mutase family enzyme